MPFKRRFKDIYLIFFNAKECNRVLHVCAFRFLMDRLDVHGDNWRSVPLPVELDEPIDLPYKTKVSGFSALRSQ